MKKIIFILIILMLVSCANNNDDILNSDSVDDIVPNNIIKNNMENTDNNVISENEGSELIVEENINDDAAQQETESETKNKSVIFFGDSIVKGYNSDNYSWVDFFNENYDFSKCVNAGIIDYRLSTYDDPNKWLVEEVYSYIGKEYDYVILEGGINDVFHDTPIGEINTYDEKTFIGGLETYLKTAKDNWPNAKIGYIITFYAPNYTESGLKWSIEDYKKYYDIIKNVLNNWGIPYLDLSSDIYMNMIDVNNKTYLTDYLHPNKDGYNLISPYIYDWILTLK